MDLVEKKTIHLPRFLHLLNAVTEISLLVQAMLIYVITVISVQTALHSHLCGILNGPVIIRRIISLKVGL